MAEMTKRGCIYKWHEGMEDERIVLVVSPNYRGNEKLISVLMFCNSGVGRDVVEIKNNELGNARYVHCGMGTYVKRDDMSEKPFIQVSKKKMEQIDRQLCIQLGLVKEEIEAELNFYKRKCDELIEKIIDKNIDL